MRYMSFGADAGHLMERLLQQAGTSEVSISTVLLEPEADGAALEILREAAGGSWIVELLEADDEPGEGRGDTIVLRSVEGGEIHGVGLNQETGIADGDYLLADLNQVEKVHIF